MRTLARVQPTAGMLDYTVVYCTMLQCTILPVGRASKVCRPDGGQDIMLCYGLYDMLYYHTTGGERVWRVDQTKYYAICLLFILYYAMLYYAISCILKGEIKKCA